MIELFLEAGANVVAKDFLQQTPLFHAAIGEYIYILYHLSYLSCISLSCISLSLLYLSLLSLLPVSVYRGQRLRGQGVH